MASTLATRFLLSATGALTRSSRAQDLIIRRAFHASRPASAHYLNATQDVFQKVALEEKGRVVLVDFYADWCKPCHILTPILEKLTNNPAVKAGSGLPLDLVTINTESPAGFELTGTYRVRAMPTVVAFRDGKEVNRFVGAVPESALRQFLETL